MTVYVDRSSYKLRHMIMCHMIADTHEELHEMADKIGVDRRWFQRKASTPHYDICRTKRDLALRLGAVDADRKTFVRILRKLRVGK